MNFRLTLTLAILLLAMAIGFYFMPAKSDAPKPTETTTPFLSPTPANLNTISYVNDGQEVLRFVRNGQNWRMTVPYDAAALDTVGTLASQLENLAYRQKFEPASSGFHTAEATGTDHPSRQVKITDDATPPHEYTFSFGKETVDGVYTTFNGGHTIHLVDRAILDDLNKKPDTFRDKIMAHDTPARATAITLKNAEGTVKLEKNGDKWVITAPVTARAKQSTVDEILQEMSSVSANEFTKLKRADARLDDPVVHITVEYTPEGAASMPATTSGPATTGSATATAPAPIVETLDLGVYADLTKKSSVYAAVNGSDSVFTYRSDSFDKLNSNLTKLRDPAIVAAPVANAVAFTVSTDGQTTVAAEKKSGNWTIINTATPLAGDPGATDDFLGQLRDLTAIRFLDNAGDLKSLGLDPPHVKIDLTLPNETQHEVILVGQPEKDDSGGFVTPMIRQGEPTVYLVQKAEADRILASPLTLRDRTVERLNADQIRTITVAGPGVAGGDKTLNRGLLGWTAKSGDKSGTADDMKISSLLADFTPLSAVKYTDDKVPTGTPDITCTLTLHVPLPGNPAATSTAPSTAQGLVGTILGQLTSTPATAPGTGPAKTAAATTAAAASMPAPLQNSLDQIKALAGVGPDLGQDVTRTLKLYKQEVPGSAPATTSAPATAPATAPASTQPTVQWKAVWDNQSPAWAFTPTAALVEHLTRDSYAAPATQPATQPATTPAGAIPVPNP